jgi:hypothetical protein
MFDPGTYGYPLQADFNRVKLERLLKSFEDEVKREGDKKLATELRAQLLGLDPPGLSKASFERLARWCKTDGIYGDGMMVAQRISELLFGRIIDRRQIGT